MERFPSLFVSHGAPTYALEPGIAGPRLTSLGRTLPQPAAVLVVSPHWMTREPRVTISARPVTLHDFSGFNPALYRIAYPAKGHPQLAMRTVEVLNAAGWAAAADSERGLDHGVWVPLLHLYPQADVPVFQVSMPARLDTRSALAFGRTLGPLVDEGVLIMGSGSLTHNLYEFRTGHGHEEAYAGEFTNWIREAVVAGDQDRLLQALEIAPHARRAHPTAEHYLPLLIAAGAAAKALPATLLAGGITHGVLAMDSFLFGAAPGLPVHTPASYKISLPIRTNNTTRIIARIGEIRSAGSCCRSVEGVFRATGVSVSRSAHRLDRQGRGPRHPGYPGIARWPGA